MRTTPDTKRQCTALAMVTALAAGCDGSATGEAEAEAEAEPAGDGGEDNTPGEAEGEEAESEVPGEAEGEEAESERLDEGEGEGGRPKDPQPEAVTYHAEPTPEEGDRALLVYTVLYEYNYEDTLRALMRFPEAEGFGWGPGFMLPRYPAIYRHRVDLDTGTVCLEDVHACREDCPDTALISPIVESGIVGSGVDPVIWCFPDLGVRVVAGRLVSEAFRAFCSCDAHADTAVLGLCEDGGCECRVESGYQPLTVGRSLADPASCGADRCFALLAEPPDDGCPYPDDPCTPDPGSDAVGGLRCRDDACWYNCP